MVPMAKEAEAGQWEVGTGPQRPLPHLLCTRGVGESGRGARVGAQQSLSSLSDIVSEASSTHSFSLHIRAKFVVLENPRDLILVCIELSPCRSPCRLALEQG